MSEMKIYLKTEDIVIKPFWVRWFCFHHFTSNLRVVFDRKGNKHHAKICVKCGKRNYID